VGVQYPRGQGERSMVGKNFKKGPEGQQKKGTRAHYDNRQQYKLSNHQCEEEARLILGSGKKREA